MACVQVPALTKVSFILPEHTLSKVFEQLAEENLLTTGREGGPLAIAQGPLAIAQGTFHDGVPANTVVVDGGWSKQSYKHSYNSKSSEGVIFEAATKKLLFIGMGKILHSCCH